MDEKVYVGIEKETGEYLCVKKADGEPALCMFWGMEDVERFLISWGWDPNNWRINGGSDLELYIENLTQAMKDGLEYAAVDPPINKGRTTKVISLAELIDYGQKLHAQQEYYTE